MLSAARRRLHKDHYFFDKMSGENKQRIGKFWSKRARELLSIIPYFALITIVIMLRNAGFGGYFIVLGVFAAFSIGQTIYSIKIKKEKFFLKKFLVELLILAGVLKGIFMLFAWSSRYGYWGIVAAVIALGLWRVLGTKRSREKLIEGVRDIETLLYGQTCEEFAEQGKRPPKFREILFKKKGEDETMQES